MLVVAIVFLYLWAGLTVFCATKHEMHAKEKPISFIAIMALWPLMPIYCLLGPEE